MHLLWKLPSKFPGSSLPCVSGNLGAGSASSSFSLLGSDGLQRRHILVWMQGTNSVKWGRPCPEGDATCFSTTYGWQIQFSSVQFRCSVVSHSLWPHGLQHAWLLWWISWIQRNRISCSIWQTWDHILQHHFWSAVSICLTPCLSLSSLFYRQIVACILLDWLLHVWLWLIKEKTKEIRVKGTFPRLWPAQRFLVAVEAAPVTKRYSKGLSW